MDNSLFDELVHSLKEGGSIMRGEMRASRRIAAKTIDVRAVRERTGLSQSEFAHLIQVSVKTLQNWEQHRRAPTGPAAALLKIVDSEPRIALEALHR
ncbi:hypothetical protein SDC9_113121 [bioreactor metagenome]|uniref:HTH cro/C1-type domain-containing protein n=1 Tax=bioreactor metagenome TaxID=1076179 RepID=A0A645BWT3_9ZZZZ